MGTPYKVLHNFLIRYYAKLLSFPKEGIINNPISDWFITKGKSGADGSMCDFIKYVSNVHFHEMHP